MNRNCLRTVLFFCCLLVPGLSASGQTGLKDGLTRLGPSTIREKRQLPLHIDEWFRTEAYFPLLTGGATRYALDIEAATTPSSGQYIVVKSLLGQPDILLNPRPDNDNTRGTVKLTGSRTPYLQFVQPVAWSHDGGKLLIIGGSYGDSSRSVWSLDLKTMQGIPISRVLRDERAESAEFSPDGKFVTYVVTPVKRTREGSGELSQSLLDNRILRAKADGSDTRKVAQGLQAAWSPDSRHLLLATVDRLWITDPEGKQKRQVFPVSLTGRNHYPPYISEPHGSGPAGYRRVAFDKIGWLDDTHLIVTVGTRKKKDRYFHDVWILETTGKLLQVIPSVSLYQIWSDPRSLLLLEEHADREGEAWYIKY